MLLTDKLEKIWQDHKEVLDLNCKFALKNALHTEVAAGPAKGPKYDLRVHLVRIDRAWRFFAKNKPKINDDFFKILVTEGSPELAKIVWPNDYKK